jgi:hypothetical protein
LEGFGTSRDQFDSVFVNLLEVFLGGFLRFGVQSPLHVRVLLEIDDLHGLVTPSTTRSLLDTFR